MTIEKRKDDVFIKTREADFLFAQKSLTIGDFLIDNPGEYEIKGVFIEAFPDSGFFFSAEGLNMVYAWSDVSSSNIEKFGEIDILFSASEGLARRIEPKTLVRIDKIKKITIKPESGNLPKIIDA